MGWKAFFSFLFVLFSLLLLTFYWFIPMDENQFQFLEKNSNFSLNNYDQNNIQFYENMRFPDNEISYKIDSECTIQKRYDMEKAFEILENLTILSFYQVPTNEDIIISCDSESKIQEGLFIAGEGGPVNITKTDNFNVILKGKILLITGSECQNTNIAIHELLHVLGFNHSYNPNSIMYAISDCDQVIGQDIIDLIDDIYSIPSYPDLTIGDVSAVMRGRYLDSNITIKNNGLKNSGGFNLLIYADDKLVKKTDFSGLDVGYGKIIMLKNIFINQLEIEKDRKSVV